MRLLLSFCIESALCNFLNYSGIQPSIRIMCQFGHWFPKDQNTREVFFCENERIFCVCPISQTPRLSFAGEPKTDQMIGSIMNNLSVSASTLMMTKIYKSLHKVWSSMSPSKRFPNCKIRSPYTLKWFLLIRFCWYAQIEVALKIGTHF